MTTHQNHVPPGVARGAVTDDQQPDQDPVKGALSVWAEKNLTVQNFLILLMLLFQAGGWWQRQQASTADLQKSVSAFEVRLQAAETAVKTSSDITGSIYVRRDVLDVTLRSMDDRLKNIETWMDRNGKDRQD